MLFPSDEVRRKLAGADTPSKRIDEWRGLIPLGSFVGSSPQKSSVHVGKFWDDLNEISELHAQYQDFLSIGLSDKAKKLFAENRDTLKWRKNYQKVRTYMGTINKLMVQVYESTDMTGKE